MIFRKSLVRPLFALVPWGITFACCFPAQAEASSEVSFSYQVPASCHVTLVIDSADGRRVRNLMADTPVTAGSHTAVWDGLDDVGKIVAPGTYTWKGLTRGDLHLTYKGAFMPGDPPWMYGKTGGWLADHYAPCAVLAYKNTMLIGSGVAENGHGLVATDLDGRKQWGITWLSQAAWQGVASEATDGERVFATGFSGWGDNWVWEVNPETGDSWPIVKIGKDADPKAKPPIPDRPAPFEGPLGLRVVGARRVGATRWDGELFVSDLLSETPRTFVFSTQRAPEASPGDTRGYYNGGTNKWYTVKLLRTLPVRTWGLTWLPDGRCIVVLDRSLAVLDTMTGTTKPLVKQGLEAPYAIASDAAGRLFVSDRGGQREWDNPAASIRQTGLRTSAKASMQVKVFDASGHFVTAIGREGGQGAGPVDPNALDLPGGVAVDARGRVWITEETATKRVSIWDVPLQPGGKPKLLREFFGPGAYGEGAYMLDPTRPSRLVSGTNKVAWDVDLAKQTYKPVTIPSKIETPGLWTSRRFLKDFPFGESYETADGSNWFKFTHDTFTYGGKTYGWYGDTVAGFGVIGLRTPAGDIKPLAAFGAIRNYVMAAGRYSEQWVPLPIIEAAKKLPGWPALAAKYGLKSDVEDLPHEEGAWGKWPTEFNFFNWTDGNGDGQMQANEITLHSLTAQHGAPLVHFDQKLNALVSVYGRLFRMSPLAVSASGAPAYNWDKAEAASLDAVGVPSAVMADGSQLMAVPADDVIRSVDADMKQRWSYPSLYHGHSHRDMDNQRERVNVPGAVYGAWNMQGVVPGPPGVGAVFMLHSGMGTNYLFTRDGLFIAPLFKSIYHGGDDTNWSNVASAKPGMSLDQLTLGDECFNGSLVLAEKTEGGFEQGHYYLLGLGRRIVVELTGMDTVQRLAGQTVELTPELVQEKKRTALAALADKWRQHEQDAVASIPYADRFDRSLLEHSVRERLPNHARIALWHNERGLGITALLDYPQGTPFNQVFTNAAPGWERDFAYGDTLDLVLGPDATKTTGDVEAFANQRISFCERSGKVEAVRYRWMSAASAPVGARVLADGRKGAMVWVADLLPLDDATVERFDPANWTTHAIFKATLPWSTLGMTYRPGMKIHGDIGYAKRLPGGAGLDRQYAAADTGAMGYDLASALDFHADLWRSYALRPNGYVMPPEVNAAAALDKGETVTLDYRRATPPVVLSFGGAKAQVSANNTGLNLKWQVTGDSSPLANGGADWTMLFKSGDACDLQIDSPSLGKCRYLFSIFEGKPVAVRYRFEAKDASLEQGVKFQAGAGSFFVPVVERLPVEPQITRGKDWYTLDVSLPWTVLGITPKPGERFAAEFGVLRSDDTGTGTVSRTYWNSGQRGMVVDTPTEAKPTTNWGSLLLK
jgi:hypothetical protein